MLKKISFVFAVAALVVGVASTANAAYMFNTDLTLGSTGPDVVALQDVLVNGNYLVMPAGVAKGYFGSLTQAAVAKWQAAVGIAPAAGYVGPISRAKLNSMDGTPVVTPGLPAGCSSTAGYSTTSGVKCDSGTSGLPGGCTSTAGYSPITGNKCDSSTTGGPLEGGAGSIESYDEMSEFNDEEVGEDEEDVEVAGIEIEADDSSDLELTAVKLDFSTQPGNDSLEDFITEVAIMLDGEEVARLDADDFNDDNDWTKTVTLDSGAVIKAGETGELVVAVTGVNNIDSDDAGDDWGLDFTSVRFEDAQGAIISEDPGTDVFLFNVVTFAQAADVELTVNESSDNPVAMSHEATDGDKIALLVGEFVAEGSDIEIKEVTATTTPTGTGGASDIASQYILEIDGEEVDSVNATACVVTANCSTAATAVAYLFDDVDFTVEEGDTVEFRVIAQLNDISATFVAGDSLTADVDAEFIEAEDETGEDLGTDELRGSAEGEAQTFYEDGISVELTSVSDAVDVTVEGSDNDYSDLVIKFDVTSFGQVSYIPDVVTFVSSSTNSNGGTPTTAQGIGFHLEFNESSIPAMASSSVSGLITSSTADDETNSYRIGINQTESFTLRVRVNNASAVDGSEFRAVLTGINFADTDSATGDTVYTANLEDDFRTDWGYLAD